MREDGFPGPGRTDKANGLGPESNRAAPSSQDPEPPGAVSDHKDQDQSLLAKAIIDTEVVRSGQRILVAFSGGPDSSALLLALLELASHWNLGLRAHHVDHGLRDGSERECALLAQRCRDWQVAFSSERIEIDPRGGSVEAGARRARYARLETAADTWGCDLIAVGHTREDLAETVILNLLRGSGIAGLRGMGVLSGRVFRPFLGLGRDKVERYLADRSVSALSDPMNHDLRYRRVLVRRVLLPVLESQVPDLGERLERISHAAQRAQARLEGWSLGAVEAMARPGGGYSVQRYRQLAPPLARFALRSIWLREAGPPGLARSHLEAWDRLLRGPRPAHLNLPRGLVAETAYGRFRLQRSSVTEPAGGDAGRQLLSLSVRPCSGCDDVDALHLRSECNGRLRLGFRRPGMRLKMAGGVGSRKLQDILVDAKVPRSERDRYPLVLVGDDLVWVPGLAVSADYVALEGKADLHVTLQRG